MIKVAITAESVWEYCGRTVLSYMRDEPMKKGEAQCSPDEAEDIANELCLADEWEGYVEICADHDDSAAFAEFDYRHYDHCYNPGL